MNKLYNVSLIAAGAIVLGIIICDMFGIDLPKTVKIVFAVIDVIVLSCLVYSTVKLQKEQKQ